MSRRAHHAVILLGPPGSGKGTQARLLQANCGIAHIDFGHARRNAVERGTPAGLRIKALGDLVSTGKLLDNDMVEEIFQEAVRERVAGGASYFVLDGYPRNLDQLQRLQKSMTVDMAVALQTPFESLLRRTDGRLIHMASGRTYHPVLMPPKQPMKDDITDEPLSVRRLSDTMTPEDALRKRCAIESSGIDPLIDQLKSEGLFVQLEADGPAEVVHNELLSLLRKRGTLWPPVILPASIFEAYAQKGWVAVEGVLDAEWVASLRDAVDDVIALSATSTTSTEAFDITDGHSTTTPALRKIKRPHLWHPAFLAVSMDSRVLDVVEQLIHTNSSCTSGTSTGRRGIRWQGDKIVIKAPKTGKHVVCHQDWAYYPHTNDDLCTVSVVLEDMSLDSGGLCFVPGSHRGPLYSHHNEKGDFLGGIADTSFDPDKATWETAVCPAGSLIIHHARTVHASPRNVSPRLRPLLLLQYAANDAWPLQQHVRGAWGVDLPAGHRLDEWALYTRSLLRGKLVRCPRLEAVPVSLPVPWPGRGSQGALYRIVESAACTLDTDTAGLSMVGAIASVATGHDQVSGQEGSYSRASMGSCFAWLWERRASPVPAEALEWQRLLQFVGSGPYGSLYKFHATRERLQAALVNALQYGATNDDDVYDALHACFHGEVVGSSDHQAATGWSAARTQKRAQEIAELAKVCREFDDSCAILDVGCADGTIVAELGRMLGLPVTSVHGCDSKESMQVGNEVPHAGMTFTHLPPESGGLCQGSADEPLLPYGDGSFDLIISLMTLHHVRRLKRTLDEVFRVLRPGGLFIFREHSCHSRSNAAVVDIMHGLHHRTWAAADDANYRQRGWLQSNYKAYYQSAEAWNMVVTAAGLSPHSVMGAQLRPYSPGEILPFNGDSEKAEAPLSGVALITRLQNECAERQSVHFTDPKGVIFGVYVK